LYLLKVFNDQESGLSVYPIEKMEPECDRISRKEALLKISKYTALTALGTFMILNHKKAQASSQPLEGK
jgi:hypothetical protein